MDTTANMTMYIQKPMKSTRHKMSVHPRLLRGLKTSPSGGPRQQPQAMCLVLSRSTAWLQNDSGADQLPLPQLVVEQLRSVVQPTGCQLSLISFCASLLTCLTTYTANLWAWLDRPVRISLVR
eukprot:6173474-Pleurochrysis_carterae.AAC.2